MKCQELFAQAMASTAGIEIELDSPNAAISARHQMNRFRAKLRNTMEKFGGDPDPYGDIVLKLRDNVLIIQRGFVGKIRTIGGETLTEAPSFNKPAPLTLEERLALAMKSSGIKEPTTDKPTTGGLDIDVTVEEEPPMPVVIDKSNLD